MIDSSYKYLIAKAFQVAHSPKQSKNQFCVLISEGLKKPENVVKIEKLRVDGKVQGSKQYDPGSFGVYLSEIFLNEKWEKIKGNYSHYIAVFCGFDDFDDFLSRKDDWPGESEMRSSIEGIRPLIKARSGGGSAGITPNWQKHVIGANYFKEIELGKSKYRVNCITYTLHWAKEYILNEDGALINNNNEYRYILLERQMVLPALRTFETLLEDQMVAKRFEFRAFWKSKVGNPFQCDPVEIPAFNDLVFYEKWNTSSGRWDFYKAIVGVIPNREIPKDENFSILIPDERGEALLHWFSSAWINLEPVPLADLIRNK